MRNLTTNQLRKEFLDFFAANGHRIVSSDSLVPADDLTVLFTSAGMNQFKQQFVGRDITYKRAATCQKCLRTGDLDEVGKTPFHHTFFEMLGNFSFGDYFKEDAIDLAWRFLTEVLQVPKEKLWISVYKDDKEAADIWRNRIGVPSRKIKYLSTKENFWPSEAPTKGPNGPCGPCSEIFFNKVEIWNLVFTQFNRIDNGTLKPLPSKNIDTGMGLERMSAVLQNKKSNFEIDIFQAIIDSLMEEIRLKKNAINKSWRNVSSKIIVDHIRAVTFAINDGVVPSNEDRGYVVRKLIRRSMLQCRAIKIYEPILYKLIPVIVEVMKQPYPDLASRRENIAQIVKNEEESFLEILDNQVPLVKDRFKKLSRIRSKKEKVTETANAAFEFYDTYGVPYEILEDEARKQKVKIDQKVFQDLLASQRKRSQAQSSMKGDIFNTGIDLKVKKTEFIGYKVTKSEAKILKILKDGKAAGKISLNDSVEFVLDKTPFYAESGGQVADIGVIKKSDNAILEVSDAKSASGVVLHHGKVLQGEFRVGDKVSCFVDEKYRLFTASNHTATHLLQSALRKVLGDHIRQAGSLVDSQRLRFDFSHFNKVNKQQLERIEEIVNDYILLNTPLSAEIMELNEAKKKGALAFFSEKYQEKVRVVSVGGYSMELCGGTHLESTAQIGIFKIISESAVSQGVRRIEAVTSKKAYELFKQKEERLSDVADVLKVPIDKINSRAKSIMQDLGNLHKKYGNLKLEEFKRSLPSLIKQAKQKGSYRIFTQKISDINQNMLRTMVDLALKEIGSGLVCFASKYEDRVFLVMGITKDLIKKGLSASSLIKDIAGIIGGSGGGRADFAQAGGADYSKVDEALSKLSQIVK